MASRPEEEQQVVALKMFVSAHASQARFDVEECGSHPSVSLGRVVPASDLPSACLDENISREGVEPLALGIAEWHAQISPAGDCAVFFRDSAFEDDVAKTNLVAILEQRGFGNVRSL